MNSTASPVCHPDILLFHVRVFVHILVFRRAYVQVNALYYYFFFLQYSLQHILYRGSGAVHASPICGLPAYKDK